MAMAFEKSIVIPPHGGIRMNIMDVHGVAKQFPRPRYKSGVTVTYGFNAMK